MTRKTKDGRLKLDRFPPLTVEQKATLHDMFFEIQRRLRQGTYFPDDWLWRLKSMVNEPAPDPLWCQSNKLMNDFCEETFTRVKLLIEFAHAWPLMSFHSFLKCAKDYLAKVDTESQVLELLDLLVPEISVFGNQKKFQELLLVVVGLSAKISSELDAAYLSRASGDLYTRVLMSQEDLRKELEKFVERVRLSGTTERDRNLTLAYFNLAMQLGDRNRAATIAGNAPWRFAHEQIGAKYSLWTTRGGSGVSKIQDDEESLARLCGLRDKCLHHFLFTAACQVAEVTGEAIDFEIVEALFGKTWPLTEEQEHLMVRAYLACSPKLKKISPDFFDAMVEKRWAESFGQYPHSWHGDNPSGTFGATRNLLGVTFMIEVYKQGRLSVDELVSVALTNIQESARLLALVMVAETVGAKEGLPLLERAYALAQDERFSLEERITALCRIARLKEKFEENSK